MDTNKLFEEYIFTRQGEIKEARFTYGKAYAEKMEHDIQ